MKKNIFEIGKKATLKRLPLPNYLGYYFESRLDYNSEKQAFGLYHKNNTFTQIDLMQFVSF